MVLLYPQIFSENLKMSDSVGPHWCLGVSRCLDLPKSRSLYEILAAPKNKGIAAVDPATICSEPEIQI